jgi:hypothetical protein
MRAWSAVLVLASIAQAAPVAAAEAEAQAAPEAVQQELDPSIFDDALSAYHKQDWSEAATLFFGYLKFGGPNAENREWAQFFLADSLASLGLWHAAVHYYSIVAKTRSRPEILPQALARLEAISRQRPIDELLVFGDVIYDSEFGTLPQNLIDFVNYIQGLLDYRNEFVRWGDRHFAAITTDSVYALKARFTRAVSAMRKKEDDKSVASLDAIIESPINDKDTKNKAHLALARMLYDMGRYADSLREYEKVKQTELTFEQAQLLLEKAWAAYQIKEPRRSLGFLQALDAPSYQRYFLPDSYILRALILKDLCHFIPAKRTLRSFRYRYARGLEDLRRRAPLIQNKSVFDGATQDGPIARRTALIKSLEAERRLVDNWSSWVKVELDKHLGTLYDLAIREQLRRWRIDFDQKADAAARDLLDADEQVSLLDYEIGLDIFKRLKADAARQSVEERLVVPYDSQNVYYEFDGEYWNDELHSYQVFVTNRCFEAEGTQR